MLSRPVPLKIQPGIHLTDSQEASQGRFTETQWVRFVNQLPEKVGGYEKLDPAQFTGTARGALCWNTAYGDPRYAFGTSSRFYVAEDGVLFTDRTPAVTTTYLTDAMAATSLSPTVTITHTAHGLTTGDRVLFRGLKHDASGLVGGLDVDGVWTVTVTGVNTYTITHGSNASATVSAAGGRVLYVYSVTNPLAATSGSPTIVVTRTAHGLADGQRVEINAESTIGGLTINGVYTVAAATANTFEITASGNSNANVAAGGGEVIIEGLLREGASALGGGIGGGGVYGAGTYGSGPYGAGLTTGVDPIYIEPRFWSIDDYGEDLVINPLGEAIYYYDTSRPGRPTPMVDAPASCRFVFVTDERIVTALGVDGDPLKMAWSDQGDLTQWVATTTNQASAGRKVRRGSRLLAGVSVGNGVNLLWTDTTCYVHQYTGGELVYDTRIAPGGLDGGIVGPLAYEEGGPTGAVYWMGPNGFRMFDGSVRQIPRADDIEEYVYKRLNADHQIKAASFASPVYDEVWFTFPLSAQTDTQTYAMVNLKDYSWSFGTMARSCGSFFDRDGQNPIWFGNDGYVYRHEIGVNADGAALPYTLSYAAIGDGGQNLSLESLDLDFQRDTGEITVALSSYDADPATIVDTDTLVYDSSVDGAALQPRIHGRFIKMTLTGGVAVGDDFRMGVPKIAIKPRGKRRA